MATLVTHLWEMLFGESQPKSPKRPGTVKLRLEQLEELTLLSTYSWALPTNPTDHNWSDAADWAMLKFDPNTGIGSWVTPNAAPGANDDVWLTPPPPPPGQPGLISPNSPDNSIVDANFSGTVKSLHLGTLDSKGALLFTFDGHTLTLNHALTVTTESDIYSGTVAGSGNLNIGDPSTNGGPPQQYAAVLNWQGGVLAGPTAATVYVNSLSTANISGAPVKTLDGRQLLSDGTVNWTGGGNILLKDAAQFIVDGGAANFTLSAGATIDGNGEAATQVTVVKGATLNVNPQATGPYGNPTVTATLVNSGTVNIDSGSLLADYNATTTGQYTIASGSYLLFNGANLNILDGTAGGGVLTGGGQAYFGSGSHVKINGTVNVGNVDDNSGVLDDSANSTLIVNGAYIWRGTGKWAGTGVTQIGTNTNAAAVLNLAAADNALYDLERQVVNYGTITWTKAADINVTGNGSITNNLGSTFDIQVGQSITGTGQFTDGGLLKKSAGGDATISAPFLQTVGGKIQVVVNKLHITNPVKIVGAVEVDAGATLAFDGGVEQDGGAVTDSGTITVAGDYVQNAGTTTLSAGALTAGNVDVASGAVFSGDGAVTANVSNAGEVDALGTSPLAVAGTYTQTGGVTNVTATLSVTGALDEQGGAVNLNGGNLQVNGGYTVESAALLDGGGTLTADVTNDGTIQVGSSYSIGGLSAVANSAAGVHGNLTEGSTAVLDMALAGAPSYDTFSVAGTAALGGTLNVRLLNNFMPTPGQWFNLIPGLSSGAFATLNLPSLGGETLVPEYNAAGHGGFSLLAQGVTTTDVYSSANPSPYGHPVTIGAGVQGQGALTGTVSFYDGTTLLATVTLNNGTAYFTISTLSRGSHSITAVYSGDAGDLGSTSSVLNEMIM